MPAALDRNVPGPGGDRDPGEQRRRQRQREKREPPVDLRHDTDDRHPDDPGRGRTGERVRDDPRALPRLTPRRGGGDARGEQGRDPDPHRNLRERQHRERRRRGARERADRQQSARDAQQRSRREPNEQSSGDERRDHGQRRREDPQLPRRSDGDPEVGRDVAQDRRQDEHAGLARDEREKERERRRRDTGTQPSGRA